MLYLLNWRALAKARVFRFGGVRGAESVERLRFTVWVDETSSFGFTGLGGDVDWSGRVDSVLGGRGVNWEYL